MEINEITDGKIFIKAIIASKPMIITDVLTETMCSTIFYLGKEDNINNYKEIPLDNKSIDSETTQKAEAWDELTGGAS